MKVPPLFGLVLAGGRSTRMGRDKGLLNYHGKPQREHMWEMLDQLCEKAFISVRKEQLDGLEEFPTILDDLEDAGPAAGLLAAHNFDSDVAWLVLGCDYPWLTKQDVQHLIDARDSEAGATAFLNQARNWPEPLLAIWEPDMLRNLASAAANGRTSPRKLLEASGCNMVAPLSAQAIVSADDPASANEAGVK